MQNKWSNLKGAEAGLARLFLPWISYLYSISSGLVLMRYLCEVRLRFSYNTTVMPNSLQLIISKMMSCNAQCSLCSSHHACAVIVVLQRKPSAFFSSIERMHK